MRFKLKFCNNELMPQCVFVNHSCGDILTIEDGKKVPLIRPTLSSDKVKVSINVTDGLFEGTGPLARLSPFSVM